jgi:hypothetical protein
LILILELIEVWLGCWVYLEHFDLLQTRTDILS